MTGVSIPQIDLLELISLFGVAIANYYCYPMVLYSLNKKNKNKKGVIN